MTTVFPATIFTAVAEIMANLQNPIVLCARDCRGMPVAAPILAAAVDNASLLFTLPKGTPIASALTAHPETAVSVLDVSHEKGFQLKGKTSFPDADSPLQKKLAHGSDEILCLLAVQEVFGVFGGDKDLNQPLWECDSAWSEDRFRRRLEFTVPDRPEERLPQVLVDELRRLDLSVKGVGLAAYLATLNDYGVPNISPRLLVEIESGHWLFGNCDDHKTSRNIRATCASSVVLIDWPNRSGYIATGWVELQFAPETIQKVREYWDSIGFTAPILHADNFYFGELNEFSRRSWKQLFVDTKTLQRYTQSH